MAAPQPMPLEEIEKYFQPPPAAVTNGTPEAAPPSVYDLSDLSDLTPVEIPFRLAGKPYLLREASEAAVIKWRAAMFREAQFVDGKPTNLSGMAPLNSLLVSLCVFEADTGKSVDVETVRTWPARLVSRLHNTALIISGLEVKESPSDGVPVQEDGADVPLAPPADPEVPRPIGHSTRTMWGE